MVRPRARVRAPKGAVFLSGVGVRKGTLSSATRRGTETRRFPNVAAAAASATRAATSAKGAATIPVAKTHAMRSSLVASTYGASASICDTRSIVRR